MTRAQARRALNLIEIDALDVSGCDHEWRRLHPTAVYWSGFDDGTLWQCRRKCGYSTRHLDVAVGADEAARIRAAVEHHTTKAT